MDMQITEAMVTAAQDATPRWMNATDSEIRAIVQAALDTAGSIELPVTATIRVQIDEQAFHASAAQAVQHLHDTLPRNQNGRVTIASLSGTPVTAEARCCICGSTHVDCRSYLGQPWCWPCADGQQTFLVGEAGIATKLDVPQHTANTWIRYGDGFVPPFPSAIRMTPDGREGLYSLREVETWHKAWLNGKPPLRMSVTEPRPLATTGQLHHHLGESREFVLRAIVHGDDYDPPFPRAVCEYGEDREPLYDPEAVKAWYDALPQATDG